MKHAKLEVERIRDFQRAIKKTKSTYLKNDYAKSIRHIQNELKFYCECKKIDYESLFLGNSND